MADLAVAPAGLDGKMTKLDALERARKARWSQRPAADQPSEFQFDLANLPRLKTPRQAQHLLRWLYQQGVSGTLSSAMVSACTKTVEVWLRARDLQIKQQELRKLEREVDG